MAMPNLIDLMHVQVSCLLALVCNPCTGSGAQSVYMLSLLQPDWLVL